MLMKSRSSRDPLRFSSMSRIRLDVKLFQLRSPPWRESGDDKAKKKNELEPCLTKSCVLMNRATALIRTMAWRDSSSVEGQAHNQMSKIK